MTPAMPDPFLVNQRDPGQLTGQIGQAILAMSGQVDASVTVTGQTGIQANALLRVWVVATDASGHSADEHWVDPPRITAGNIVPGVGFTIYGVRDDLDTGSWRVQWEWKQ
jgi:hypothetical protein